MEIDYCPQCGKAGLRYEKEGLDYQGLTSRERYNHWKEGVATAAYKCKKWCPSCKGWVKPQIKLGNKKEVKYG